MAEEDEQQSLRRLWVEAAVLQRRLEQGQAASAEEEGAQHARRVALLRRLSAALERSALWSPNEALDDIPTPLLPYLAADHALADALLAAPAPDEQRRVAALREAAAHLDAFARRAAALGLLRHADWDAAAAAAADADSPRSDPAAARAAKIAAFRRKKEMQALADAARQRAERAGPEDDAEAAQRDEAVALLRLTCESAYETLGSCARELRMLEAVARMRGTGEWDDDRERARRAELRANPPASTPIEALPVASARRLAEAQRVFRPGHALPTMSIEEAGEMELRFEMDRQQRSAAAAAAAGKKPPRHKRGGGHSSSESSSSEDEDDEKLRKQRKWDDWKDDNPKGWGNTKGQG
eukprot:m51a1_g6089 hypothetical protein (355) ;mRNA; r:32699-34109